MSQVIKKRRIVLASVLKPVDDTRMLDKIGATLADTGRFEVTIIAYPSVSKPFYPGITTISLSPFKRLSWKRLLAPWIIFKKIVDVNPDLIIINTPELLWIAILNRIFYGRKILYDVLENYYLTIRYTPAFPPVIRTVLAVLVRLKEWITAPFIHHFLLAEKGYVNELRFLHRYTILENKLPKALAKKYTSIAIPNYRQLIFSGTLAPTTGILEAISLCKGLHKIDQQYAMTIIGYCSNPSFLANLCTQLSEAPYIRLIGGDQLVPHAEILNEISKSGTGIVIYKVNPSTLSSIPTKLYEYLAMKRFVLIKHNQQSHELVSELNAGIQLHDLTDYTDIDTKLKALSYPYAQRDNLYWEAEASKLIDCLKILKIYI